MTLKALIVGAGYMGKNHARVISSLENVELTAVSDTKFKNAESVAKIYKAKAFQTMEEALKNEKIDFVCIAAPTLFHFNLAKISLQYKIPTFIEKPITETVSQAKELVKLVKKNKTPFMVGHIERFNPVVNEIKNRIKNGELGKVLKIHTQRFSPPINRAHDVSAIIDLATHDIDIACSIIGKKVIRIYAEADKVLHRKEDLMSALIRFENGVIGLIEVSWLHPSKFRNLTILGENGMYRANYITQELFFYRQNKNLFKNNENPIPYTTADVVKIAFEAKEPLYLEMEAFIDAIVHKKKMPITAEDGFNALEISQKIAKSGYYHTIIR